MINDKKIEAAKEEIYEDRFLLNGEEIVFDNDAKEEMFYKEDIKEAIGLGAKWAINELFKNLWHPASEKPADNEDILVESTFGSTSYELSLGMYYCIDECDEYYGDSWEVQSAKQRITRWLYVDDLLPKEAGNHD